MINVVVEGESDREVAKAVAHAAGRQVNTVRVTRGKGKLDALVQKYNLAARQYPWVVFRDSDGRCPVELRAQLTAGITYWQPQFCFRIVHSMSEAWLLADAESFSEYFSVPRNRVPPNPEALPRAKQKLLALCAQSRSRAIRRDMTSAGNEIGPLYVVRLNEFASTVWRPMEAAAASDSLRRAIERIGELPGRSAGEMGAS